MTDLDSYKVQWEGDKIGHRFPVVHGKLAYSH